MAALRSRASDIMHVSRRFQNTAVFVASGAPQDSIGRQAVIELERETGHVLRVHNARVEKRSPDLQALQILAFGELLPAFLARQATVFQAPRAARKAASP